MNPDAICNDVEWETVRAANVIHQNTPKDTTLRQLAALSYYTVRHWRNCGKSTTKSIESTLALAGLFFVDSPAIRDVQELQRQLTVLVAQYGSELVADTLVKVTAAVSSRPT
jgi:hypothetical protein